MRSSTTRMKRWLKCRQVPSTAWLSACPAFLPRRAQPPGMQPTCLVAARCACAGLCSASWPTVRPTVLPPGAQGLSSKEFAVALGYNGQEEICHRANICLLVAHHDDSGGRGAVPGVRGSDWLMATHRQCGRAGGGLATMHLRELWGCGARCCLRSCSIETTQGQLHMAGTFFNATAL